MANILEKLIITTASVCAEPSTMQCQQLIALSADENINAIEALVIAPTVAGPNIAMPKMSSSIDIWSTLELLNNLNFIVDIKLFSISVANEKCCSLISDNLPYMVSQ